jgi:GMP synthase-like glutamine amidotransferase
MKPVAIFRHFASEGPGHFATFLDRHAIPWRLFKVDAGDAVPQDPGAFSGLVFMGGPMSVNDDLPWIPRALRLIRTAVERDVPVLGHCLGGQLIAKALGGRVGKNAVKEIGWGEVKVADTPLARAWFGERGDFLAFHWHGETFSLPPGAERLLSSAHCQNQAYVLGGRHLGMQCHVEMTADMVRVWCRDGAGEIAASAASPGVQSGDAMLEHLEQRTGALNAVADGVYGRWIEGLAR